MVFLRTGQLNFFSETLRNIECLSIIQLYAEDYELHFEKRLSLQHLVFILDLINHFLIRVLFVI
jgi:hypothetical protein